MRSYIQPLHKQIEDDIKVKLPTDVLECLREYCEFLNSPQSYVVTEIVRKALRRDRAFHTWREQRGAQTALEAPQVRRLKNGIRQSNSAAS